MYGNCRVCGERFDNEHEPCEHMKLVQVIFAYFNSWCKTNNKSPEDVKNIEDFVVMLYTRK
jgi:hypothetical protein